jgi:hypothetical protein
MSDDVLAFIIDCVKCGRVYWTYHSNMRLLGRELSRKDILDNIDSIIMVESYGDDTPLPSCLCLLWSAHNRPIHIVVALDRSDESIRFVTVYKPDPMQWDSSYTKRKKR